ncbi:MAG TPA: tRNA (adenosine(37)-N6)-threonylcarbamoyltransferase complex ATPase subunit type 1 TsaE [Candidatus Saccharimonadales bacterium]|nr:tRNA (adenosine(37)-N6)-threonylcarbamoyltransferase complex ATPase subunit type 1 TsaE [Candidatus Saccharimonadales bacterium]
MKRILDSLSEDETKRIAKLIGEKLKGGEVIELVSDLGGGKTTFVSGLVAGAGSNDQVASPSFTISKIYTANELTIKHFDFYRLADAGVIAYELAESADDPKTVIVVEWAGIVEKLLPDNRLKIEFSVKDEKARQLTFNYPKPTEYLIKGL